MLCTFGGKKPDLEVAAFAHLLSQEQAYTTRLAYPGIKHIGYERAKDPH
jgi:hypothetical protein